MNVDALPGSMEAILETGIWAPSLKAEIASPMLRRKKPWLQIGRTLSRLLPA